MSCTRCWRSWLSKSSSVESRLVVSVRSGRHWANTTNYYYSSLSASSLGVCLTQKWLPLWQGRHYWCWWRRPVVSQGRQCYSANTQALLSLVYFRVLFCGLDSSSSNARILCHNNVSLLLAFLSHQYISSHQLTFTLNWVTCMASWASPWRTTK